MPNQQTIPQKLTTNTGPRPAALAYYDSMDVTPSDSVDLVQAGCRGVYATGAGNIAMNIAAGGTAVFTGVVAGQFVPCAPSRILATLTTATGLKALY